MAFTWVQVVHTYKTANQLGALGTVEFTPVDQMHNGGETVPAAPIIATLSSGGALSVTLAATTDLATWPIGVRYRVVERLTGQLVRTFYITVPHTGGSTQNLADLIEQSKLTSTGLYPSIPVAMTPVGGVLTPDASQGAGPFRYTTSTDITLGTPINGTDGQEIIVEITANGGDRTLSFPVGGPNPIVITSGAIWSGRLRYNDDIEGSEQWLLDDDFGISGGGGSGGSGASLPNLATGRYFSPLSPHASTTTNTLGNETLRLAPWVLDQPLTIDRLAVDVTGAGEAGSTVRLGVYSDDGSGRPSALLLDGGAAGASSVATPELTVAATVLPAGLLWIGGVVQAAPSTQPTVRVTSNWTPPIPLGASSLATVAASAVVGYSQATVTGTLPLTFTGTDLATVVPRVLVRVA